MKTIRAYTGTLSPAGGDQTAFCLAGVLVCVACILTFVFGGRVLAEEQDAVAAANAAARAASGGPSEASGYNIYRRGFYEDALKEWRLAAAEGDAGAAFRLGEEYFDAKVVERDVGVALKWYRMGAEGGDPRAQMDLATLYDNGWGVEQDQDMAAKWYHAAARQGMSEAQYNIGTMFEVGTGVELNLEQAYMYYLLAIKGGFAHFATTALENLSRMMSPAQIKEASAMARNFEPEGWDVINSDG